MNLDIIDKLFEFRGFQYELKDIEDIDGFYYNIHTNKNTFCFDLNVTINKIKFDSVEELKKYLIDG